MGKNQDSSKMKRKEEQDTSLIKKQRDENDEIQ